MQKFVRKVIRLGKYSSAIVIPNEIVGELNIREKQKMTLRLQGRKIILEDWKK